VQKSKTILFQRVIFALWIALWAALWIALWITLWIALWIALVKEVLPDTKN